MVSFLFIIVFVLVVGAWFSGCGFWFGVVIIFCLLCVMVCLLKLRVVWGDVVI